MTDLVGLGFFDAAGKIQRVTAENPLPIGEAEQEAQTAVLEQIEAAVGELANGSDFADVSVSSLTANQAAGTDAILATNASRKSLMINPPADCVLTIATGETAGWPLFANVPNTITGQECPTNTLFVSGLAEAAAVTIWEA